MATKVRELSVKAKEILEVLQASDAPMTLAEIKELVPDANASHLTALKNRGMATSDQVEKEVVTVVKRKVNSYTAVETDAE